jgi:hypothetical protein
LQYRTADLARRLLTSPVTQRDSYFEPVVAALPIRRCCGDGDQNLQFGVRWAVVIGRPLRRLRLRAKLGSCPALAALVEAVGGWATVIPAGSGRRVATGSAPGPRRWSVRPQRRRLWPWAARTASYTALNSTSLSKRLPDATSARPTTSSAQASLGGHTAYTHTKTGQRATSQSEGLLMGEIRGPSSVSELSSTS